MLYALARTKSQVLSFYNLSTKSRVLSSYNLCTYLLAKLNHAINILDSPARKDSSSESLCDADCL